MDRQALPGVFIDHRHQLDRSAVIGAIRELAMAASQQQTLADLCLQDEKIDSMPSTLEL